MWNSCFLLWDPQKTGGGSTAHSQHEQRIGKSERVNTAGVDVCSVVSLTKTKAEAVYWTGKASATRHFGNHRREEHDTSSPRKIKGRFRRRSPGRSVKRRLTCPPLIPRM
ncbi:uncharacterized protein LOC129060534 isoform X3 [Pongo abelii]|uniref:uncharacterized protein LOC129060534 isoform X3 n=1 Tax=Pongo abelii TaxID=9601 RepID=UPI0023E8D6D7|nr:uncharacterized protein LOC129060534 isoform X3 [Pongo abelii]